VTIDLTEWARPALAGRWSRGITDETVALDLPGLGGCFACTRPRESAVELYEAATNRSLGRLALRGAMNLSPTRPTGIAHASGRGLIAVATRSGSVHLIAIRPGRNQRDVAASESGVRRR
jgi:glycerol-3-phosphate acyltransferase PlsY